MHDGHVVLVLAEMSRLARAARDGIS